LTQTGFRIQRIAGILTIFHQSLADKKTNGLTIKEYLKKASLQGDPEGFLTKQKRWL
jgi:hypothetical protein